MIKKEIMNKFSAAVNKDIKSVMKAERAFLAKMITRKGKTRFDGVLAIIKK